MTKRTPGLEGTVQNTVQAGETDEMDGVGAAREEGAAPVAVREAAGTLFHAIGGAVTDATERAKVSLGETVKELTILQGTAKGEPPDLEGVVAGGATIYKLRSDKGLHYTRSLVISAGAGAFSPRRLTLKEAPGLENHGLHCRRCLRVETNAAVHRCGNAPAVL